MTQTNITQMGGLSGWGANNVNRILGVLDKQIPVAISMMPWCQHISMLWQFRLLMMTLAWRGQGSIRTRGFSCCGCANCAVCTTMFALSSLMSSFTITLLMFIYMCQLVIVDVITLIFLSSLWSFTMLRGQSIDSPSHLSTEFIEWVGVPE